MGEGLAKVLKGRIHLVRHVQFADNPGRNEPGTGAIGLPYRPTRPAVESIAMARTAPGL